MSTSQSQSLLLEISGSTAIVTFNRSKQRNSLSSESLGNFDLLLTPLLNNAGLRTIIFSGTDDVFLSGADIRELAQLNADEARVFSQAGQRFFDRVAATRQVTIAAINGYCIGGGLDFALACDIRIAAESAVFAHPGARLGIITGWGGTQRLPRLIGKSRALELFLTARQFSSHEALNSGLITEICDPVQERALELAEQIALTAS